MHTDLFQVCICCEVQPGERSASTVRVQNPDGSDNEDELVEQLEHRGLPSDFSGDMAIGILGAYCSCRAGKTKTCSHIASLLLAVEFATYVVKERCRGIADEKLCTEKLCRWLMGNPDGKMADCTIPMYNMVFSRKETTDDGAEKVRTKQSRASLDPTGTRALYDPSDGAWDGDFEEEEEELIETLSDYFTEYDTVTSHRCRTEVQWYPDLRVADEPAHE
jgi:hypothetical protein